MLPSAAISFKNKTIRKTSLIQIDLSLSDSVWGPRRPLHMIPVFQNGRHPAVLGPRGKRRGQRVILWLCLLSSFGLDVFNKDGAEPASVHCVCVCYCLGLWVSDYSLRYYGWFQNFSSLNQQPSLCLGLLLLAGLIYWLFSRLMSLFFGRNNSTNCEKHPSVHCLSVHP